MKKSENWTINNRLKSGQKTRIDTPPKKIYKWQINVWKEIQHYISLGFCKLKQWYTTTHLSEWPKSTTLTVSNAGKDMVKQDLSFIAKKNAKCYGHFRRLFGSYEAIHWFNIRFNNHTPVYPKDLKTCVQMFIAALFIFANIWKQLRYPSIGECINNHMLDYYSGIKRNDLSSQEKAWRNFKCVLLS